MRFDLDLLQSYVADGLVNRSDQGDLSIYNYAPKVQFGKLWDEVTRQARGLIINRATGETVALPWRKFFNDGEEQVAPPPEPFPLVTVKMDGSLGILYRHEGRIRWSTRGSMTSAQAQAAQEMWDAEHAGVQVPEAWTVLAEIIHPAARIVIPYDFQGLVVLGARDRFTGDDVPFYDVQAWCRAEGVRCVEVVPGDLNEAIRLAEGLDETHEGFVIRWPGVRGQDDYRLKVKGSAYIRVHRLLQGLTEQRIGDLWYSADRDTLALLPEEHLATVLQQWGEMDEAASKLADDVASARVELAACTDRKSYAVTTRTRWPDLMAPLMSLWDSRPVDYRALVYRNRIGSAPRVSA